MNKSFYKNTNSKIGEKKILCLEFWRKLTEIMEERGYVTKESDTGTMSWYLFPEGDEKYLSWRRKPRKSFRVANFWSWYANTETCLAPTDYIQCLNQDFGYIGKRRDPVKGTSPRRGWAVAYTEDGYRYRTIFGWKRDRETNEWEFITPTVEEVLEKLGF